MTRNWPCIVAVGVLAAACAEPGPPPASAPAPAVVQPAAPGPPDAQGSASAAPVIPSGPISYNLPPSAIDTNPPGTPSYVIAPGDSVGRRNAQLPRPGGAPAF
jgi:hypothetical protein